MLKQAEMKALLGRSLTPVESENFDLYLKIAKDRLNDLTCLNICDPTGEARRFKTRAGYRSLNVGVFTDVESVTVDGEATTDYTTQQFDSLNGSWWTTIVFDEPMCAGEIVEVDASWGFRKAPHDLQLLLSKLFANVGTVNTTDGRLSQKRIEDTSFTYRDATANDQFLADNAALIAKYSLCSAGDIQHGDLYPVHNY